MELLTTTLALSVNDPLPDLPNFPPNVELSLGTRYGEQIRIILKLATCIFSCATGGTSLTDFSLSVKDRLPDLPTLLPKWINWSMNHPGSVNIAHIKA